MNYVFTPYAYVNPCQTYLTYPQTYYVDPCFYYFEEPKIEKQIDSQKSTIQPSAPEVQSQLQEGQLQDELVDPLVNTREEKNLGFKGQDKERNIYSNILKSFFIALYEKRSMDDWIKKLLSESENSLSLVQILEHVQQLFGRNKSYFSPKYVREFFRRSKFGSGIGRIVAKCLYKYLKSEFLLTLLLSTRIKRKSKLLQMKKARELLLVIKGTG